MKPTHRLLILIVIASLFACNTKTTQESTGSQLPVTIYSNQVHVITLYVNTTDIKNPNLGDYADFGQASKISNEDYTTHVRKGDIVVWKGVSTSDSLDVVNITSINHHGGPELFSKSLLRGNGGDNEVVVGVITKGPEMKEGTLSDKEKYVLHFKVKKHDEPQIQAYKIDPYIKLSQ